MGRSRKLLAVLCGFAVACGMLTLPTAPVSAAVGDRTSIVKSATATTVAPGDEFDYQIQIQCTDFDDPCEDVVVTDPVPAEYLINGDVTVVGNVAAEASVDGQNVTVHFSAPVSAGSTHTITIPVRVDPDLPRSASGLPVTNTATIVATNADPVSDSAVVTPEVPLTLGAELTKIITPESGTANPGTSTLLTFAATNSSNDAVDNLTIQDPYDLSNLSSTTNPFHYLSPTGTATVSQLPEGADQVVLSYYVDGSWVNGPASAGGTVSGPAVADLSTVRAVRLVFSGAIEAQAVARVQVNVAQNDRVTELTDDYTVNNQASATTAVGETTSNPDTSSDTYFIGSGDLAASAGKSFSPSAVTSGEDTTLTLTGTNTSSETVNRMIFLDNATDIFSDGVSVTGWGNVTWPTGATEADITFEWQPSTGGSYTVGPFTTDVVGTLPAIPEPTNPGDVLVGFGVGFTGDMPAGASTSIGVTLSTPADGGDHLDADSATPGVQWPNEVQLTTQITDPDNPLNGSQGVATGDAVLTTYSPQLQVDAAKNITPSRILGVAGTGVVVQLPTTVADYPDTPSDLEGASTVGARTIVVQDPSGTPTGTDDWWSAFDASAITQTAVPADATLRVDYYDLNAHEWRTLLSDIAGPAIVNHTIDDSIRDVIGGLRFTFVSDEGTTFDPGTTVQPNYTATLRETLTQERSFTNAYAASASNGDLSDDDGDTGEVGVEPPAGDGTGNLIDKEFVSDSGMATVKARSGDQVTAQLNWSTGGYQYLDQMVISDTADPEDTAVASSVFDAFDLVSVQRITAAMDPLLTYDQVTRVELWNGTDWVRATNDPCPDACDGTFPGVTLTSDEQDTTLGVRLAVVESPTRADRIGTDPTAPQVGTGVASSMGNDRALRLVFEVRDTRRSDSAPALGTLLPTPTGTTYNVAGEPGMVDNTARATGYDGDSQVATDTADDTVTILDVPLNVGIDKSWSGGPLSVPPDGVSAQDYPSGRVTISATNRSAAKVDSLTISDPVQASNPNACAASTSQNTFDVFDLTGIVSISTPGGADATRTRITLDGADPAVYSGANAISQVLALDADDLAGVTGVTVEFGGRIDASAKAVLVFDTRLRETLRSDGTDVTAGQTICNVAEAQVADAGGNTSEATPTAQDDASITLQAVGIGLDVTKTITPEQVTEPQSGPVAVVLTGQPTCEMADGTCVGYSRASEMTLTDDDPRFWNQYDLTGLDAITLAAPVDQVRVDALVGGTFSLDVDGNPTLTGGTWVEGAWSDGSAPTLPDEVQPADVQGLRYVFSRADGGIWENPQYPVETVGFQATRRATLNVGTDGGSDSPVQSDLLGNEPAPGETSPGVATDTVDGFVEGADLVPDGDGGFVPVSATDTATDDVTYHHALNAVEVTKLVNGVSTTPQVAPASTITYTLTMTNTGDVPIVDPVMVDDMPTDGSGNPVLQFDPDTEPESYYSYALSGQAPDPASGTAMPTDASQVTSEAILADDGTITQLRFGFPAGTVLEVGQTYTVTVAVTTRPGLVEGSYTNTVGVTGERAWDSCNGEIRNPATAEACTAQADFRVTSAVALRSQKFVRADLSSGPDLGVFATKQGVECAPEDSGAAEGFYANPCVPRTAPGQDEQWRMVFTNTGNQAQTQMVAYDLLPYPGDTGAINPGSRGSQWQPVLAGLPVLVDAPQGATLKVEYLTQDVMTRVPACDVGSGTSLLTCPEDEWQELTGTETRDVRAGIRALRFSVTFPETGAWAGGGQFSIDLTTTTPAYAADADVDQIAYNSVAAIGETAAGASTLPAEGLRVGVALASGPVEVVKEVTGDRSDVAPESFDLTLECTSLGEDVPLGDAANLTVTAGVPATVDGIPYGSECTVTEPGGSGATEFTATTVTVGDATGSPARIVATNRYDATSLRLLKTVDTSAVDASGEPIGFGLFSAEAVCTFAGRPVYADGYEPNAQGAMSVDLAAGESADLTGLPVGAVCTVTETDTAGASSTSISVSQGDGEPVVTDGASAGVILVAGEDQPASTAEITNVFATGTLALSKVVDGDGAAFGVGPFTVDVRCTLPDGDGTRTVWDGEVTLGGTQPWTAEITDIPAGANCEADETGTGGATSVAIDPGTVQIVADQTVTATITNTYAVGSLEVTKQVTGAGAGLYGSGPFEVSLTCTLADAPIEVPGGATRAFSVDDPARYDGLPVGAQCVLDETDDGGATTSVVEVDGEQTDEVGIVADGPVRASVTNTFDLGALQITKTFAGFSNGRTDDGFDFALACTLSDGTAVTVPGGAGRTVSADGGWTTSYADLPAGATCTLTETRTGDADHVAMSADGHKVDVTGASAAVVVPAGTVGIEVENSWGVPLPFLGGLPRTGSSQQAVLALGAALVALAGGVWLVAGVRRRRETAGQARG
ncbi:DUF5979 domain-containing protein [Brooklawnia cerclae]|uniref:LPXTG-motif cell wall-anchored protein n=1 Tax=Brooklawnia cerclae TaxID=349934 RepID=A0ABX0SDE8_9ACTN|nr:LPXTG-motif cell wall-anchored protein [Brooklawnia cerclae]